MLPIKVALIKRYHICQNYSMALHQWYILFIVNYGLQTISSVHYHWGSASLVVWFFNHLVFSTPYRYVIYKNKGRCTLHSSMLLKLNKIESYDIKFKDIVIYEFTLVISICFIINWNCTIKLILWFFYNLALFFFYLEFLNEYHHNSLSLTF